MLAQVVTCRSFYPHGFGKVKAWICIAPRCCPTISRNARCMHTFWNCQGLQPCGEVHPSTHWCSLEDADLMPPGGPDGKEVTKADSNMKAEAPLQLNSSWNARVPSARSFRQFKHRMSKCLGFCQDLQVNCVFNDKVMQVRPGYPAPLPLWRTRTRERGAARNRALAGRTGRRRPRRRFGSLIHLLYPPFCKYCFFATLPMHSTSIRNSPWHLGSRSDAWI